MIFDKKNKLYKSPFSFGKGLLSDGKIIKSGFTCPVITISPASISNLTVGQATTINLSSTGGTAPYTYTVTSGSLPTGLTLNGGTGVISGTPTTTGAASFQITSTDANSCTGVQSYSFNVNYNYLLDTYTGATGGYSLRKLTSTANLCIRVRRSSDNAEQDIGFLNNVLDTSSLLSFVGANNGFITRWYNQANNNQYLYSFYNTIATNQPLIVSSGNLINVNSKPAAIFDSNDAMAINNSTISPYTSQGSTPSIINSIISIAKIDTYTALNYVIGSQSLGAGYFYGGTFSGVNGLGGFDQTNIRTTTGEDLNQNLGFFNIQNGNLNVSKNGSSFTNTGSFNPTTLGWLGYRSANYFFGKIQEVIIYPTEQSINKTGIESNINSFYSIY